MKRVIVGCLVISFSLLLKSCNSVEPPNGQNPTLTLTLEDISCTETWITLTSTNIQLPATITLKQNNQIRDTINLMKADTLLYIDSLLPNTSFQYQVSSNQYQVSSNVISVTTMDTTSHNFTFETFTFGNIGNSVLFDVEIINENNIWAVGEIRITDTSAIGYTTYNAVHWDGVSWELTRITVDFRGNLITPILEGVYAFSTSDIWFVGSLPIHGDGDNWIMYDLRTTLDPNISLSRAWGTSSSDIYFVGRNGNMVHYNGTNWQSIESGTDVDLLDVWGTPDGSIVWASGKEDLNKTALIKINGRQANLVFEDYYPWQIQKGRISGGISSIWTNSNNFIFLTTPIMVYRCLSTTSGEGKEIYPYDDYLNGGTIRIRGTASNDIITSGSNCSILHYNGFSWKRYEQFTDINTKLWSSDNNGNILIGVGDKLENLFYYKAIIIVGYK